MKVDKPTIIDFTNANHNHSSIAQGGAITYLQGLLGPPFVEREVEESFDIPGNDKNVADGYLSPNVAFLNKANVFTADQTISNTAPQFDWTDTTASAKSLRLKVDANKASFYEAAGSVGDILSLDLTNKRVGIRTSSPSYPIHLDQSVSGSMLSAITNSNTGTAAFCGMEIDASKQAFSLRAYGEGFNTFTHAGVSLAGWAEFWSDELSASGNAGLLIGTNSGALNPPVYISAGGTVYLKVLTTGIIQMPGYGAGAATFDASGNISSVSDEKFKTNIRPFTRGLESLIGIIPITHKYTKHSGLDTEYDYTQFSAQNVKLNIPEAIYEKNDSSSFYDRAILATTVNAINQLRERIEVLEK